MEPSPTQMAVWMREASQATKDARRRGDEDEVRDCLARETRLKHMAFGDPAKRHRRDDEPPKG